MSIAKKLKVKENTTIVVVNGPANYAEIVGDLPAGVHVNHQLVGNHGFVHLFVKNKAELTKHLDTTIEALAKGALLWISYPKGSSKIQTDLTRDKGWEELEKYQLQWASLISLDEKWSAFCLKNLPPKAPSKATTDYNKHQAEWIDAVKKEVKIPSDLAGAFNDTPKAAAAYHQLAFSNKKEYVLWIVGAKREETRTERLRKTIEKLLVGKKNPAEK